MRRCLPQNASCRPTDMYRQGDCNLFTFTVRKLGSRRIVERVGSFYLGDMVTRLYPGRFTTICLSALALVADRY